MPQANLWIGTQSSNILNKPTGHQLHITATFTTKLSIFTFNTLIFYIKIRYFLKNLNIFIFWIICGSGVLNIALTSTLTFLRLHAVNYFNTPQKNAFSSNFPSESENVFMLFYFWRIEPRVLIKCVL